MTPWTPLPATPQVLAHAQGLAVAPRLLRVSPPAFSDKFAIVRYDEDDCHFLSGFWYSRCEALAVANAALESGDPVHYCEARYDDPLLRRTIAVLNNETPADESLAASARSLALRMMRGPVWPVRTPEDEQYLVWREGPS